MTVTESHPGGTSPADTGESRRQGRMQVRKRNGDTEPVDVNKIVRAVERCAGGLQDVDPLRVATKTISGLYDGATTAELDRLSIQTAADLQDVQELANFFERRVSAYQVGVSGDVGFDDDF